MRTALGLVALLAVGVALVSGGSSADSVRHRYLLDGNQLRTVDHYGTVRDVSLRPLGDPDVVRARPRWLALARPLEAGAPAWARRMYRRSLLVLRGLAGEDGAVIAGARAGWAYVWPRDAATVAMAFAAAGYRAEARRVVRFLLGLDLATAARFQSDGTPVGGRGAQGDAAGWVVAAARAVGVRARPAPLAWEGRADYQEGAAGSYLGNALASAAAKPMGDPSARRMTEAIRRDFEASGELVREAGDPSSGADSAAAWAVRPFAQPALLAPARRTLLHLTASSSRYGMLPSEGWRGGDDPWTAPTAWSAWSLAALARRDRRRGAAALAHRERRAALRLMAELRRDVTPAGLLPERVDARTGVPVSTTPLAWSHAFAILALSELWPQPAGRLRGQAGRFQRPSQ
jgi:hypothetical protein